MQFSMTRWTTVAGAAALIVLPGAAFAQTPPTTPPATPTQQTTPAPEQQPAAAPQTDAAAAKQHLSEAREALSQITAMPEAAKLQGDARTQVSQLISNFNELITTQSNWRGAYAKLDANLTALLGGDTTDPAAPPAAAPTSGTTGAVGTSGTVAALDPAIKTKLMEFRTHLKAFEKSAGGVTTAAQPAPDAMPPSAAPAATSNPANPATAATAATGTTGATPPPADAPAAQPTSPAPQQAAPADASKELDAISEILNKSKTGALTKAETTELRKHVETLRVLLNQGK
jgi:nicotinate-nucleotide--dimethylbenzimidazole phosphoribosyltransferase